MLQYRLWACRADPWRTENPQIDAELRAKITFAFRDDAIGLGIGYDAGQMVWGEAWRANHDPACDAIQLDQRECGCELVLRL